MHDTVRDPLTFLEHTSASVNGQPDTNEWRSYCRWAESKFFAVKTTTEHSNAILGYYLLVSVTLPSILLVCSGWGGLRSKFGF